MCGDSFILITGRFIDYPLLLEILLHRGETGLLEVSSPSESGYFYIKDGEIKDGELGKLRGAKAVEFARTLTDASFQFNAFPPAEYARVVWEKSFESLRKGLTDPPYTQALTFHSALRQALFYVAPVYLTFKKALVSTASLVLSYAGVAYEFKKKATTKALGALRETVAEWLVASRAQGPRLLKRISKCVSTLKLERAFALIRNRAAKLPHQEADLRRYFAVITTALIIVTLISNSQVEVRRPLASSERLLKTSVLLGVQYLTSQVHSLLWPQVTDPALTPKSDASDKGNRQRSTRQMATPNRHRSITRKIQTLASGESLSAGSISRERAQRFSVAKEQETPTQGVQTISVVLQIENDHVSQASLLKHRAGMERYEAAALRIARQRRYLGGAKRTETVIVKVSKSNPD